MMIMRQFDVQTNEYDHRAIMYSIIWDLSHNIIIIVPLECHHTKTIYCMSPFRWNIEKKNRFYMLQDNKYVLNCLYFYIRTYTDVFYMYCILFCLNVYVYISVPIYVFILIMNPGFNRSILCIKLDCFLCFVRNDEINRYIYIYIYICAHHKTTH